MPFHLLFILLCLSKTLMTTSVTLSSSSPFFTGSGLSSGLGSATSCVTSLPLPQSTLSTLRTRASPPFTMSDPYTITLSPIYPTSTAIDSTSTPGTTQSRSDTTQSTISSISSTPFIISASTFLSSTFPPSTLSTPPSISAISPSSISGDNPTVTVTSTLVDEQTITVSSVAETGVLSTDTPHNIDFAHQTGAIIGVVLGGTFLLLLIILFIFFACKQYRSNRSYNSSAEDILPVSHNASWRPPLQGENDEHYLAAYGRSRFPNYPKTSSGQGGGFFDGRPSIKGGGSGSAESAEVHGTWPMKPAFAGQPPMSSVAQTLHRPTNSMDPLMVPNYSFNDGNSQPWWGNTEPLSINKRSISQQLPDTVDSDISVIGSRSASSLGLSSRGSPSNGHHGPRSSGEELLSSGNTWRTIINPRPIHLLNGRRHCSTPPAAFALRSDSSHKYSMPRIQQYREERKQEDRADKTISQVILARLRASRRPNTVNAYSHGPTIRSEELTPSRAPSYMSPSLLNPPISVPQTVHRLHFPRVVTGSSYIPDNTPSQHHRRQGTGDTSEELHWPDLTPPSPAHTDTSSMVEGLLHPRLGMALALSQQASATSLRDHEDYSRPINGLVNNHIRSTTTFETQDSADSGEV